MKKNKTKNKKENSAEKTTFFSKNPILHISLKSLLITLVIAASICYSDNKGYFNPDETKNHTKKKWDSYYEFSKNNNIDILLLGNSHLYTGINPKNLSATLGVNAFILAAPGTNISDSYFGLKEAIKKTKPKLVVIETYGIKDFNPYQLKEGSLSDQFKSFGARKDFLTKITSTPYLFKSDNYLYAWSNTLRNHDFIFKDTTQLTKNKVLTNKKPRKNSKLYLGRYVRFQKGIEKDILQKYDSLGSPVKGDEYTANEYTEVYVEKVVELCKENEIELMFLTLPMYYKHIENYSVWNNKVNEILGKYPNNWLNMQNPYDTINFNTTCFENTYSKNQHMTYNGSLIATYKLAEYLKSEMNINLPDRKKEIKWINTFYGQEGYFENNPVLSNDKANTLICKNFTTKDLVLKEVSIIKAKKGKDNIIITKVQNNGKDLSKSKLRLTASIIHNKQLKLAQIDLSYDYLHKTTDKHIFKSSIKSVKIKAIKSASIIYE